jgi:hypothetical protein
MQSANPPLANRTFVAGTDTPPPETVPFNSSDFGSEEERRAILSPWQVTDRNGGVLAVWRHARAVFETNRRTAVLAAEPDSSQPNQFAA